MAEASRGGDQNVRLTRLDFLQRANIQVRQLRQFLLGKVPENAFAPEVNTKLFKLSFDLGHKWHADMMPEGALQCNGTTWHNSLG